MVWCRSACFNVAFALWTVVFGVLCAPAIVSSRATQHVANIWVDGALWLLRVLCKVKVEIRGEEHLQNAPVIAVSKHQSTLDTLVLWRLLNGPAFILKRELLWIPIFGWYLWRTHPIAINRGNRAKALAAIARQGKARIAQGRNIIIFPEGTRTKPAADVIYKMGGLQQLYSALNAPLVPIALNTGLFWGKRSFVKHAGVAVIECLPAVAAGKPVKETLEQVKEAIELRSRALLH